MPKKILQFLQAQLAAERRRYVLWLPVALGLGAGLYYGLKTEPLRSAGAVALALSLAGWRLVRQNAAWPRFFLVLAAISAGFLAAQSRTYISLTHMLPHDMKFRQVTGTVEEIVRREKGVRLILRDAVIEDVRLPPMRLSLSLRKEVEGLAAGDRVQATATLYPPPRPVLPGAYDFARDYYFDRLGAVGFTTGDVTLVEKGQPSEFALWLANTRHSLAERLRALLPGAAGEMASALVVGEAKAIPEVDVEAMRDSGLAHIISISGLHMSIAAGLMYFGMRFLMAALLPSVARRVHVKKIAAVFALLSSLAYLLLAGSPVPAVRSFVMVAFVLVAAIFDRQGISLYSLAWAAVLILLFSPESLLGASFQMSFAATLAMLAFYERKGAILHGTNVSLPVRVLRYPAAIALTSLIATLATTPFVIHHFNRLTLWGMLANLLVIPVVSFVIMPAAVLFFLLMPFGVEHWAAWAMGQGIDFMLAVARKVAALPYAVIPVPPMTQAGFLLIVLGGLWLCLWQGRWRWWGLGFIAAGHLSIMQYNPPDVMISDDARQIAVRTPSGQLALLRGSERSFDAEIFLRRDGQVAPADIKALAEDPQSGITCDKEMCRYEKNGQFLLVAKKREAIAELCKQGSDVLVADIYVTREECAGPIFIIDRKKLYRQGAHVLYFTTGGLRMRTVKEAQGDRPWVH